MRDDYVEHPGPDIIIAVHVAPEFRCQGASFPQHLQWVSVGVKVCHRRVQEVRPREQLTGEWDSDVRLQNQLLSRLSRLEGPLTSSTSL